MKRKNWEDFLRLSGTEFRIDIISSNPGSQPCTTLLNGEYVNVYSSIIMEAGMTRVTGYASFYVEILFDENDNYLGIGVWE